jgi:hypothetical protein
MALRLSNKFFVKLTTYVIFKAAFRAITSAEKQAEIANNRKHLRGLGQGNITTTDIIIDLKNRGDIDRKIIFLGKLKGNVSNQEVTELKGFLMKILANIAD